MRKKRARKDSTLHKKTAQHNNAEPLNFQYSIDSLG